MNPSSRLVFGTLAVLSSLLPACGSGATDGTAPGTCPEQTNTAGLPGSTGLPGSGALESVTSFGDNPANLKMYVHAPPVGKAPIAVVLVLHGCTQTASDYVAAGWNEVADREGLVVVYGEQSTQNNSIRCFRWWDGTQIGRGGEAKSLASMVTAAHAKYGTKRGFVTGLSAGGAMTSVMLAAYPELFEAGAVMAGLPYKCATSQSDTFACMRGRDQSADAWGALVPKVSAESVPRVSIWHGDADYTVRPANRDQLVKQWTKVNGVAETPSDTTTEGRATHHVHRDARGVVRVESWAISGMAHGVALDPKSGCGRAGAYAIDVGVCSTNQAVTFFLGASAATGAAGAAEGSEPPTGSTIGGVNDPCR